MKHIKLLLLFALSAFAATASLNAATINFEGRKSTWNGFERTDFKCADRPALVVAPKTPRRDNAWIVRPAFFGAFPTADIALLNAGFHVAYIDLTHFYASPDSRRKMDAFHTLLTQKYGLNKRAAVEGLSRGGAFALTWANDDPSKIACVYVDNPVCDFRQWPRPSHEPKLVADFCKIRGVDPAKIADFADNPFDNYKRLAQSGIPVLMIVGDSDSVVPFRKHGEIYKDRFVKAGGNFKLITRRGGDHHPHGLPDPAPIVDFVESAYRNLQRK